jgi:quercetin dioxygenase-like cupin family protein
LCCNLIFLCISLKEKRVENQPKCFISDIQTGTNKLKKMDNTEVEKGKAHIVVKIIEYAPNSVVRKSILKKTTGNISVVSIDTGETLTEKILPFDTFVQIIDGKAEVIIDGVSNLLNTGQSIVIPAHTSNIVKANERFKMISTIIKSGYE